MCFLIVVGYLRSCCNYSMQLTRIYFIHRLVYMIDLIISSICLLLQNDFAMTMYEKYCTVCDDKVHNCTHNYVKHTYTAKEKTIINLKIKPQKKSIK